MQGRAGACHEPKPWAKRRGIRTVPARVGWTGEKGDPMKFKIVLEPSDEGGYTVYVPSLPGCISEGDTEEDSLKNIQEAIELYLEPAEDDWVPEENAVIAEIEL